MSDKLQFVVALRTFNDDDKLKFVGHQKSSLSDTAYLTYPGGQFIGRPPRTCTCR